MSEPHTPSPHDPIMIGKDDFDATVTRARDAVRARFGLDSPGAASLLSPRPRPVPAPVAAPVAPVPPVVPQSPVTVPPPAPQPAVQPRATTTPAPRQPFAALHAVPAPAAKPTLVATSPAPSTAAPVAAPAAAPAAPAMFGAVANETKTATAETAAPPARFRISVPILGASLLILAAAGGGVLYFQYAAAPVAASSPAAATTGTAHIATQPAGAHVTVDGVARGVTPLSLTLAPGDHALVVTHGTTTRTLPLAIEAGTIVKQYVDFGAAAAIAAGRIEIISDPPNAPVSLDGAAQGVTPLVLDNIAPGPHTVTIGTGDAAITRSVDVAAGATASVVVSMTPSTGAAGWVAVKSPLPLELYENGKLVAAAGVDRVMLPTGRHELEVAAAEFDFRTTVTINVQAGRTVTANVAVPNGVLSINAVPWADVLLDGKPIGTTPLANLSVPIGTHEIVWKHPQLGERRQVVKVKAQTPVRVGMDFGK